MGEEPSHVQRGRRLTVQVVYLHFMGLLQSPQMFASHWGRCLTVRTDPAKLLADAAPALA